MRDIILYLNWLSLVKLPWSPRTKLQWSELLILSQLALVSTNTNSNCHSICKFLLFQVPQLTEQPQKLSPVEWYSLILTGITGNSCAVSFFYDIETLIQGLLSQMDIFADILHRKPHCQYAITGGPVAMMQWQWIGIMVILKCWCIS